MSAVKREGRATKSKPKLSKNWTKNLNNAMGGQLKKATKTKPRWSCGLNSTKTLVCIYTTNIQRTQTRKNERGEEQPKKKYEKACTILCSTKILPSPPKQTLPTETIVTYLIGGNIKSSCAEVARAAVWRVMQPLRCLELELLNFFYLSNLPPWYQGNFLIQLRG